MSWVCGVITDFQARFIDRDMFMHYRGGGAGHKSSRTGSAMDLDKDHHRLSSKTSKFLLTTKRNFRLKAVQCLQDLMKHRVKAIKESGSDEESEEGEDDGMAKTKDRENMELRRLKYLALITCRHWILYSNSDLPME